jgi:hypothetical protein
MVNYFQINSNIELPSVEEFSPYKAVVIVDLDCEQSWQKKVSEWLVSSCCKYMMAWGKDCSSWDDSVDNAFIQLSGWTELPNLLTTWHDDEPLSEVFEFCKYSAMHEECELDSTLIVHISDVNQKEIMLNELRIA